MKFLHVLIILCCLTIGVVSLSGCGESISSMANTVTEKAIGTYIDDITDNLDFNINKDAVVENKQEIIDLALEKYLNDESIKNLGIGERVKQAKQSLKNVPFGTVPVYF